LTTIPTYDAIRAIAQRLVQQRYPTAVAAIIGGSFATGRQTPSSDIDLLLLFDHVDCAWRDTIVAEGRTVELFAHDLATFTYFCKEMDAPGGTVPLAMMVVEGENIVAAGDAYAQLHALAHAIDTAGPPALDAENLQRRRYAITTALEDLVDSTQPSLASCTKRWPTCTCARPGSGAAAASTCSAACRRSTPPSPDSSMARCA
jgi:hypothetical protein